MDGETMDVDSVSETRGLKRAASDAALSNKRPRKIQALDPDVVNKIAAGEIIIAPMHALKELIENSVDAGSTSVEILVRDGGLKLLQITDNGHGIDVSAGVLRLSHPNDDLPILCERFTTSKLKSFEDLSAIATYGFRGEALASISHIAHLTVTTKTAGSSCAWRAHYSDGKLAPAKPGQSVDPKPTAGRGGTQITVEDLFYNVPTRRRAFRSASEEYAKILDIVGRYAVHCGGTAFSCKKHGESGVSLSTSTNASTVDRIRQLHGSAVANELVSFEIDDKKWGCRTSGWVTTANFHAKRTTLLLFINHRAVESSALKRAMEQTYSTFLPKGGHPFIYLSLEIEPHRVDVNVHPTKREVNFLNEEEIIESICSMIRTKLAAVDSSRTFMTQTLLPRIQLSGAPAKDDENSKQDGKSTLRTLITKRPYEHNLVRTDAKMRKITSMLPQAESSLAGPSQDGERQKSSERQALSYEKRDREPINIRLSSVKNLRAQVRSTMHNNLTETFASTTYVGLVDERRRIVALQSGVKLYLVDYGMVCNELFYQLGLTDFANFGKINLESCPKLVDLIELAVEVEREAHANKKESMAPSDGSAANAESEIDFDTVAATVASHLVGQREMLNEYFSMDISEDGDLLSIPLLLKGYMPSLAKLPRFLLRLGPYVDWTNEEACFHSFLSELAAFYTPEQLPLRSSSEKSSTGQKGKDAATKTANPEPRLSPSSGSTDNANIGPGSSNDHEHTPELSMLSQALDVTMAGDGDANEDPSVSLRREQLSWMLEHTIFPTVRARLVASNDLVRGVVEVADLKGLYRVFERC
ncbi:DNA mismatch repair protein [Myotisia sp. PD_48]|nr:DNA mismatch repair protein [Myotisia sp. PD_48]